MASADRWKKKQPAPDAREARFDPGQLARALRIYIAPDGRCQDIVLATPDGAIAIDTDGLLADLLYRPPPAGLGLRG